MNTKKEGNIRKGDLVQVSEDLLRKYEVIPPRAHASFYGVVDLTMHEIELWYSKWGGTLGDDGESKIAPRTKAVILDTGEVYIVNRAKIRSPDGARSTGWCQVIDPRKGFLLKVKRSYLQPFKESGE